MTFLLLFVAAFVGGALNSVAGGGSFIALPALMSAGVAPVAANATSTLALWPGSASSALAYRREVVTMRSWLTGLGFASLVGGLAGGWLLIRTSDERFLQLLPWLMLAAAVTFTFGGQVTARLRAMSARRSVTAAPSHSAPTHPGTAPRTPAPEHPRTPHPRTNAPPHRYVCSPLAPRVSVRDRHIRRILWRRHGDHDARGARGGGARRYS